MLEGIVLKKVGNKYLLLLREILEKRNFLGKKIIKNKGLKEVTIRKERRGKLEQEWYVIKDGCSLREAEIIVEAIERYKNGA